MTRERTDIEVEVLEIDGVAPVEPQAQTSAQRQPQGGSWQDWRSWQGRVRRLDSRWWPLGVLLGMIAVALVVTVGLGIGAGVLVVRVFLKLMRALVG